MNCAQIEELLSDLIDGELGDDARTGIEQHLAGCAGCAALYRQMKRTVRFVRHNAGVPLRAGTGGGAYADFTRALVDPQIRTQSWRDLVDRAGDEGDPQ
jgi:anti-sigma factor RsiW